MKPRTYAAGFAVAFLLAIVGCKDRPEPAKPIVDLSTTLAVRS